MENNNLKLKIIFVLFLFLITLLVPKFSLAATYYVDQNHPQASDSNPGTQELPWKTINKASQTLIAGDTVFVKEGTYLLLGRTDGNFYYLPILNPSNSGMLNLPITFKSYPGHRVIIKSHPDTRDNSNQPFIGSYQRDYIIWDGFIIDRSDIGSNNLRLPVSLINSKGVIVQNCEVIGNSVSINDNHAGIWLQDSENIIIRNNKIHEVKGRDGSFGIKDYRSKNVLIENNKIYNCQPGAIQAKHNGEDWVIRYNIVYDCGEGFVGGASTDYSYNKNVKIYQNIFYNINSAITPLSNFYNSKIYNNVFYNTAYIIGYIPAATIETSFEFFNNIVVNTISTPRIRGEWYGTYTIPFWDYNLYYSAPSFDLYNPYPLSQWRDDTRRDLNSFISDPKFVSPPSNFYLQPDSPALKAGIDRQDYDQDGNTSERINMGAYITDNECIGLLSNCQILPDTTPPSPPTGVTVS